MPKPRFSPREYWREIKNDELTYDLKLDRGRKDPWIRGFVETVHGVVLVHGAQRSVKDAGYTSLKFFYKGWWFEKSEWRGFTKRGLVTKARQYASGVVDRVAKGEFSR